MTFGQKLSSLRKQANMTQNDLAIKLDVSRQAITKWERGIGLPDIDNLKKLASVFNTTIDQLIDYKIESIKLEENGAIETIDKENSKLKNVNKFVLERFDKALAIYVLQREVRLSFWQKVFDFFIGAGTLEVGDMLKTGLVYSYLVQYENADYLVLINKTQMVTKKLDFRFDKKYIIVDGYKYTKNQAFKIKNCKTKDI